MRKGKRKVEFSQLPFHHFSSRGTLSRQVGQALIRCWWLGNEVMAPYHISYVIESKHISVFSLVTFYNPIYFYNQLELCRAHTLRARCI
jgi:hypothetical protein